jgi:hypothetical protein
LRGVGLGNGEELHHRRLLGAGRGPGIEPPIERSEGLHPGTMPRICDPGFSRGQLSLLSAAPDQLLFIAANQFLSFRLNPVPYYSIEVIP